MFAYIPTPGTQLDDRGVDTYLDAVSHAGFANLLDMRNVYAGSDEKTLYLAEWDRHPNARGHAIIADALFRELTARPAILEHRAAPRGAEQSPAPR